MTDDPFKAEVFPPEPGRGEFENPLLWIPGHNPLNPRLWKKTAEGRKPMFEFAEPWNAIEGIADADHGARTIYLAKQIIWTLTTPYQS